MLLGYNVVADRKAKAGPLASRLRGEERLKELALNLRWNANAVIADVDFDRIAKIACRHLQGRLEISVAPLLLAFGSGIEAIAEKVETDAETLQFLTVWLSRPLPAAGWCRGLETRRETRGLIRASLLALVRHTPDMKLADRGEAAHGLAFRAPREIMARSGAGCKAKARLRAGARSSPGARGGSTKPSGIEL